MRRRTPTPTPELEDEPEADEDEGILLLSDEEEPEGTQLNAPLAEHRAEWPHPDMCCRHVESDAQVLYACRRCSNGRC